MTRTSARLGVLVASAALLAAACASSPDGGAGEGHLVHEGFGVRADLSGWQAFTDADSAPPALRGPFANKRGPDDPPWFLALRGEELLSVGVQRTDVRIDRREFLRLMQEQLGGGSRISNARELSGGDLIFEIHTAALAASAHYLLHADAGLLFHVSLTGGRGLPPLERFGAALARIEVRRDGDWEAAWRPPISFEGEPLTGWGESAASQDARGFEPADCREGAHPLLWSAATGAGRVHLFGSIHFGHDSFYPLAPPIEEAFAEAERLVVEMDLEARQQEFSAAVLEGGEGAPPRPLSEQLPPGLHAELSEALAGYGLSPDLLEGMSPGLVSAFLTSLAFRERGFDPEAGVDLYFLRRAGGREIVELETVSQQMGVIGGFDEAMLRQALASLERVDDLVDVLHRAWRCGDEEALVGVLSGEGAEAEASPEESADREDWRDSAVYTRNEQMAERIAEFFEAEGDTFVVVGAAHLVGERGIPALLREAGYPVERVGP